MVKFRLTQLAQPINSAAMQKYETIFAKPLSEFKHEAFKVLFHDKTLLDDFTTKVDMLLAEPH
jgi:hypothetical protein